MPIFNILENINTIKAYIDPLYIATQIESFIDFSQPFDKFKLIQRFTIDFKADNSNNPFLIKTFIKFCI